MSHLRHKIASTQGIYCRRKLCAKIVTYFRCDERERVRKRYNGRERGGREIQKERYNGREIQREGYNERGERYRERYNESLSRLNGPLALSKI